MTIKMTDLFIRQATLEDLPSLRDAHRSSIMEIASAYYPKQFIEIWGQGLALDGYRQSMEEGETFFIAAETAQSPTVLGFSSHQIKDGEHHLQGLYVSGAAARKGIGTQLLRVVEEFTRAQGGHVLKLQASLSGEPFYKASGYTEHSRSNHPEGTQVVIMKKDL